MRMAAGLLALMMASVSAPAAAGELTPDGFVTRLDIIEWTGQFAIDHEHNITIHLWDERTLQIDFHLSPGLLAHARGEIAEFKTTQFSVLIPEGWIYVNNQIVFKLGPDGAEFDDNAGPDDCVITLALDWHVNWIDVTDTEPCRAEMNLAGRYEFYWPRGSLE